MRVCGWVHTHMCTFFCLHMLTWFVQVHATSVFMCMCMYKPWGETQFKVECDNQPYCQIKTCQPCSPAPLFLHLFSLSVPFLHPYCSLKQVPALISQKNNWEVYHLQYPGPRLPPPHCPSRSLQQCQLPLEGMLCAGAKCNHVYHWLIFSASSVCFPLSFCRSI